MISVVIIPLLIKLLAVLAVKVILSYLIERRVL
jgi:hypothetical protein